MITCFNVACTITYYFRNLKAAKLFMFYPYPYDIAKSKPLTSPQNKTKNNRICSSCTQQGKIGFQLGF
jgi:hypothetical protein